MKIYSSTFGIVNFYKSIDIGKFCVSRYIDC